MIVKVDLYLYIYIYRPCNVYSVVILCNVLELFYVHVLVYYLFYTHLQKCALPLYYLQVHKLTSYVVYFLHLMLM